MSYNDRLNLFKLNHPELNKKECEKAFIRQESDLFSQHIDTQFALMSKTKPSSPTTETDEDEGKYQSGYKDD